MEDKKPNFVLIPDPRAIPTHAQLTKKATVTPVNNLGKTESNQGRTVGNSFADIFGARSSVMDSL